MRLAQMPLIGRESEIHRLMGWSKQAIHQGGIASVTGAMGAGKTAIVDEWTRQLELEGATVLRGRYRQDGTVLEGLRAALRPIYDEAAADQTLPTVLTPQKLKELRGVLELDRQPDPNEPTDVGQDWRFVCIEQAIGNLSRARPTVVVLEDIHWADSFSLRFLAHWQEELATQTLPVILVLTSRSDEFGITQRLNELSRLGQRYSQVSFAFELEVNPLPHAQARQLLDYVIPMDEDAAEYVLKQARGNPLYLTQIARFMADEGLVDYDDDSRAWGFAPQVERETRLVPPNLGTLWSRRVKGLVNNHPLGGVLKALLARAVLIGGRFDLRVLKQVLQAEGRTDLEAYLDDALEVLSQASILVPTVVDGRPAV
jgi:predicted ATPase